MKLLIVWPRDPASAASLAHPLSPPPPMAKERFGQARSSLNEPVGHSVHKNFFARGTKIQHERLQL
jgi:hypothetical protein